MERISKDEAKRKEFFQNNFRGNFSYNSGVSSVNSFLRSITKPDVLGSSDHRTTGSVKAFPRTQGTEQTVPAK